MDHFCRRMPPYRRPLSGLLPKTNEDKRMKVNSKYQCYHFHTTVFLYVETLHAMDEKSAITPLRAGLIMV